MEDETTWEIDEGYGVSDDAGDANWAPSLDGKVTWWLTGDKTGHGDEAAELAECGTLELEAWLLGMTGLLTARRDGLAGVLEARWIGEDLAGVLEARTGEDLAGVLEARAGVELALVLLEARLELLDMDIDEELTACFFENVLNEPICQNWLANARGLLATYCLQESIALRGSLVMASNCLGQLEFK
jgi:hypothetical protein